ncbi:MAG: mechanosensitive ion channel family protein [Oscillochloridaceae bacterium umkhey_bin13]
MLTDLTPADLFAIEFLGNTVTRWLIAILMTIGVMAGANLWRHLATSRAQVIAVRTNTFLDDVPGTMARSISGPLITLIALFVGSLVLSLPGNLTSFVRAFGVIVILVQVGIWGNALIGRWADRYREQHLATNAAGVGTARLLSTIARMILYSIILLLILDNLPGVEITALVASLGIGGIAVALAVQNILGDLFASLSIALDKPFVIGDFIIVGDELGTVEQIGLKTTRVRSISGEQLIFSNSDLLNSRIRNFQRMAERRVVFSFRVDFETPLDQLQRIPMLVQELVEANEQVRFDRAHLQRFDDIGYTFELVYFVLVPDFRRFMDVQQTVNFGLIEAFTAQGIRFASLAEGASRQRRARGEPRARA